MSDQYQQFLSSMSGVGVSSVPGQNPQGLSESPLSQQQLHGLPMAGTPIPSPYSSLGYFTGFPDPIMFNAPKSQRNRRKSAPGLDHIKHRRTRSGCYTCRSRRVKCDETHPICERCRKGKRDCVYPEPPTTKASTSHGTAVKESTTLSQQASPTSSHEDDDEDADYDSKLDPILDEDEPDTPIQQSTRPLFPPRRTSTTSSLKQGTRTSSETPSLEGAKSSPAGSGSGRPDWSQLPHDLRFYLTYYCDNITHYHYSLVSDVDNFFRDILPSLAARNEALLYAIVGFAAYHHALQDPRGNINEFHKYYGRSISLLLNLVARKENHNIGVLLTILQLATIEEYLGDWSNLQGHQNAAFKILTEQFTPQTITRNSTTRAILAWYSRFDVFTALMGGFEAALPKEWYTAFIEYYSSQILSDPENLGWKVEECSASLRFISMEMASMFAKRAKNKLTAEAFSTEHDRISKQLKNWKAHWDPAMTNQQFLVKDFSSQRTVGSDDAVNPIEIGALYNFPLFSTTIITCEWHSVALMHESRATLDLQQEPSLEAMGHAIAISQIFEAVEQWPPSPKGCLVTLQAPLSIASFFVPRDAKHHMWMRKQFALIENMGYVFPISMRSSMTELFQDPSCANWWLPDGDGFSPMLREIRKIVGDRHAAAAAAQSQKVHDIKHFFARMQLDGSGGP